MTRTELVALWRSRVFDTAAPFLWPDAEAFEYLEDAIYEACDRARLIRDSTTLAVCEITVTAGVGVYTLHPSILSILRAKLDSQKGPLVLTSTQAMDSNAPHPAQSTARILSPVGSWWPIASQDWETQEGRPSYLVVDPEGDAWRARLVAKPAENDVLRLQVHRTQLAPLGPADEPELPTRLHARLVDWMEYRAYLKRDAETFDEKKAALAASAFASAFGERIDANMRRTQEDRATSVVEFREF